VGGGYVVVGRDYSVECKFLLDQFRIGRWMR
jgi:hypothetical protein